MYNDPDTRSKLARSINTSSVTWWILLLTAVLAVPAFAIMLMLTVNASGASEMVIFIGACWLCIYLGLMLIRNSRMTPILFERVALSPDAKQRCLILLAAGESDMAKWRQHYEKHETAFMNLARSPAWDHLEEISQVLGRIRVTLESGGQISFQDVKALGAWVDSARPSVVETYLAALQAVYRYARADAVHQGKNLDELHPELARGNLEILSTAPQQVIQTAGEVLATIKAEHPMLAQADLHNAPATMKD